MYNLMDLQGAGLKESYNFSSLEEIKEHLQDFHSQDCEDTEKWSLIDCLEIGMWGIKKDGVEIDYNIINI